MILVDTHVLIELARPSPDQRVQSWAAGVSLPFAISAVTLEEIHFGLTWRPNPEIQSWFETFLSENCTILPVSVVVARRAGELRGHFRRSGQQRTQADMLIAATGQVHQLPLATRNVRDFEGCGIPLVNPFSGAVE